MKKFFKFIIILVVVFILMVVVTISRQNTVTLVVAPNEVQVRDTTSVVAKNLHVPWSVDFLPTGELIATERNGNLKIIGVESVDIQILGVSERGEGGLLGVAIHPDFESNNLLYLYFTTQFGGQTKNKVVRYVLNNGELKEDKVIVDSIPGGTNHNGGRIAFGPDGMLYITTGDAGNGNLAQDKKSLAGKILRVNDDGLIPTDNPFNNAVYSYGHRNPQGVTWDSDGGMWATEHGRSGVQSGFDEVNFITKGANYGWPIVEGDEEMEGMTKPVLHSGARTTWAPSGIVYRDGILYFAGLRGRALYSAKIMSYGNIAGAQTYFHEQYGRLRGVSLDGNGNLYITTSNTDGRGTEKAEDDKIIKLSL